MSLDWNLLAQCSTRLALLTQGRLSLAFQQLKKNDWELPGSPVVGTPCFPAGSTSLILGRGTKIAPAKQHGRKKKKKRLN